jgi:hypothetical protein
MAPSIAYDKSTDYTADRNAEGVPESVIAAVYSLDADGNSI